MKSMLFTDRKKCPQKGVFMDSEIKRYIDSAIAQLKKELIAKIKEAIKEIKK